MKLKLLLISVMLTGHVVIGQVKQVYRLEEEIKGYEEGYTVISLKQEGLALIHELEKFSHNNKIWQLEIVDTTLTRTWETEFSLKKGLVLVGYEHSPGHLFLLFREGQNDFHNFTLLSIPFHEQTVTEEKINFELNFKLTHFTMAGSSAVFGGEINGEPAVLLYNQHSDHPKVLPGLFMKNIYLLDVRMNQNQSFNVLIAEQRLKEQKKLILRTFDQDGNLLLEDIVQIDAKYSILSGITSSLERDELLVVGTYGESKGRQGLGFYSFIADPFKEQTVVYYDFGSLDHFLDYLSVRKATRMKEKIRRQKQSGETPDYTAYIAPLRLEERPDGFYLFSEMYYPSHNMNAYPYSSSYYNPYTYGYNPYGYNPYGSNPYSRGYSNGAYPYGTSGSSDVKMVQSMVVKFTPQLQAEKSFSMKLNAKQNGLEQLGDFLVHDDSILLAYKKDGELVYRKELPDTSTVTDDKVEDLKLGLQAANEVLKNESDETGAVRFWYGHHLYVWGYQTVKVNQGEDNSTRHIFYVSRITID